MGAICAAGRDVESLWDSVREGRTGLRPVTRFDVRGFAGGIGGEIPLDPAELLPAHLRSGDRVVDLALVAAHEAWTDAGLSRAPLPTGLRSRVAVVVGSSSGPESGEALTWEQERADPLGCAHLRARGHHRRIAACIADALGLQGPRLTVSTACSSGNLALAIAADLLRAGQADLVLVGGADGMSRRKYAGFDALGAIAPGACAPFGEPPGMNLGEGAAFLVLERAGLRPARERARWLGSGLAADAYHPTAPDPRGMGVARCIRAALTDAQVAPEEIDWYDAHATGTELNDVAEWAGVQAALGTHAQSLPASAPKSLFGHTFGAAGALEAVLAVLALERQAIPPTLQLVNRRQGAPPDPVDDGRARPARVDVVLSHNEAFGGHNATVVLGRAGRRGPTPPAPGPVALVGWGLATAPPTSAPGPRTFDLDLRRTLRGTDPRDFERLGALLVTACTRALEDAGVRIQGTLRDSTGLAVGHGGRSPTGVRRFQDSYDRGRTSAVAFSRSVTNAAAGGTSRALSLRGPQAVFITGPGAGLLAVAWAATRLSLHRDAERIVAAGADERNELHDGLDPEQDAAARGPGSAWPGEGAAAVVLAADGPIRVQATALAGSMAEAAARIGRDPVDLFVSSAGGPVGSRMEREALRGMSIGRWLESSAQDVGYGPAWTGVAALARAACALREGQAGSALLLAGHPDTLGVAIRLEAK